MSNGNDNLGVKCNQKMASQCKILNVPLKSSFMSTEAVKQ